MPFYAEIDENGIVSGVSELRDKETKENLIEIEFFDSSLCGKKYDRETKTFIEQPKPESPPPQPNPIEQIQEDQGAVMMGMLDIYTQLEEIKKRLNTGGV